MSSFLIGKVRRNNEGMIQIDTYSKESYNLNKVNASTSHEYEEEIIK